MGSRIVVFEITHTGLHRKLFVVTSTRTAQYLKAVVSGMLLARHFQTGMEYGTEKYNKKWDCCLPVIKLISEHWRYFGW